MIMPIQIEAKNIKKSFGRNDILKNVNLSINQNEIFGIIGESGSGKTTLLNILVGFLTPDSGKVFFESKALSKSINPLMGFATQENCVYSKLTVQENLEYFGSLYSLKRKKLREGIKEILQFVELIDAKNTVAEHLSGGMQRRLNIACALINRPRILILDEPTEDLDPILREEIIALIKKINNQKTTVILTSHLLDEAEALCTKIAILHNGSILAQDTPQKLIDSYSKSKEIVIKTASENYSGITRQIKQLKNEKIIQERANELIIYSTEAEKLLPAIIKKLRPFKNEIIRIEFKKPSLYEVFEYMVKSKK